MLILKLSGKQKNVSNILWMYVNLKYESTKINLKKKLFIIINFIFQLRTVISTNDINEHVENKIIQ